MAPKIYPFGIFPFLFTDVLSEGKTGLAGAIGRIAWPARGDLLAVE